MFEPNNLRIFAAVLSVVGSLLLAWRVKGILEALSIVVKAHELNIQQLMPNNKEDIYNFTNSTAHVDRSKGTGLLVTGFLCLAASGAINVIALLM